MRHLALRHRAALGEAAARPLHTVSIPRGRHRYGVPRPREGPLADRDGVVRHGSSAFGIYR